MIELKKNKYVFDLETLFNMFLATFKVHGEETWYEFEISDRKNDIKELREFLSSKPPSIGFNNLNFDYPVLHNTILKNNKQWTAQEIFSEVQMIIGNKYSGIKDWDIKIPQLDLFRIWNYDNLARSTSLKWLEYAMRMDSIEDLPYHPTTILTSEQMDEVKLYCRNDIKATELFLNKSTDAIKFRIDMSKELNHSVMNYSDIKIGEYINRKTYEKISGRNYDEFKDLRTYRSIFYIKDLIPNYISFKSKYLNDFLEEIKTVSFKPNENFERELHFAGIDIKFAKGGLHSIDKTRDIKCEEGFTLEEKDVSSMYTSSIINGGFYPKHLGIEWREGIKILDNERNNIIKPKMKTLDKTSNEYVFLDSKQAGIKYSLNGGGYGKTGSEYSWQYDTMVIMKTTFKGQLSLLMLIEQLYDIGCHIISANTDGVVIYYDNKIKSEVNRIHTEWEETTEYILENTNYSRIVVRDVNNYIAFIIDNDGNFLKYKFKGAYEIDRDYHKNHSKRIVAIGAANYFINGIPPEITLKCHLTGNDYTFAKNYGIFDFCIGSKMKGDNILYQRVIKGSTVTDNKLGKVNRYYVSKTGDQLVKILPPLEKAYVTETDKIKKITPNQMNIFDIIEDEILVKPKNRETNIEAGWTCTLFNKYVKKDDYNLSYNYYIAEINKLINFE